MQPELIPRVRIYLRMQRTTAEDMEDILTAGHLSWSDLEEAARVSMDKIAQLRYLDDLTRRKKNAN